MLGKVSEYVEQESHEFTSWIKSYVESLHQEGNISSQEYQRVLDSLESWDFMKIVTTCSTVEAINRWCMRYITLFAIGSSVVYFPNNATTAIICVIVWDRIIKFLYISAISKNFGVPSHVLFSLFTAIPFWKYVTPFIWLRHDKELLQVLMKKYKEKAEIILSHPIIQNTTRILH